MRMPDGYTDRAPDSRSGIGVGGESGVDIYIYIYKICRLVSLFSIYKIV